MIYVRSEYTDNEWKLNGKLYFKSKHKSWRKNAYYLTPLLDHMGVTQYHDRYIGAKPHLVGGKCLTVWDK